MMKSANIATVGVFLTILAASVEGSAPLWSDYTCGRNKYRDSSNTVSEFIIGGSSARPYQFPWQVSIQNKSDDFHFCGGSIINNRWILTAAHCMRHYRWAYKLSIVVGEHDRSLPSTVRQRLNVESIHCHAGYLNTTHQNDICLLRLASDITFNDNVRPVCAPDTHDLYVDRRSYVSGWGKIYKDRWIYYGYEYVHIPNNYVPDILKYTTLKITSNTYCQHALEKYKRRTLELFDSMVCATDSYGSTERDTCQGDSGGPLTVVDADKTFRLVGIVSWGLSCAAGYPGIYTRVNRFLDWINGIINRNSVGRTSPAVTYITPSQTPKHRPTVRLAGSSSKSKGRLEIYHDGQWGTVCDDYFDDVDARVACYSLGFGYDGRMISNEYGPGDGQIWLDDVQCTGHEKSIGHCQHKGWGLNDCGHSEDVSIACNVSAGFFDRTTPRNTVTFTPSSKTVRLAGSSSKNKGRLEIYHDGRWGTVCDDQFDEDDAKVACHSLGFGYSGRVLGNSYGPGSGPIWLDEVSCRGKETSLEVCQHNGFGVHDCGHEEDVSLACSAPPSRQPAFSRYAFIGVIAVGWLSTFSQL